MRYVTATEAADMTGLSERTIRRMIAAGTLPARRVNARRYEIAVADLPARKVDELATLQAEVADLRREVDALKRAQTRSDGHSAVVPRLDMPAYLPDASAIVARPVGAFPSSPGSSRESFRTHTAADRTGQSFEHHAAALDWLALHGTFGKGTPKTWPGWQDVELTPRAVLELAGELRREADRTHNHRVKWRLHTCGDSACVCREVLGES